LGKLMLGGVWEKVYLGVEYYALTVERKSQVILKEEFKKA